jgi:aspartate N-acetyltransferase
MDGGSDISITIRRFKPSDAVSCKQLYKEGLLGGALADNDTGLDIDDIENVYMRTPGNCFWVAETADGQIVGMIGVQHHDEGVGEIRRLRVRQDIRRRGIGSKLLEVALRFCRESNHLKVALDTFVDRAAAIELFQKYRFLHGKSRQVNGRELLYFYLDIYGRGEGEQE